MPCPLRGNTTAAAATPATHTRFNDPCQLNAIGLDPCDWDKHFILTANINLSAFEYTTALIAPDTDNSTSGFQGTAFTGVFDGAGFVISNLTIDDAGVGNDHLGLFGKIEDPNAEVKNLGLENVNVTGDYYLGGLVGKNNCGSINNCYVTGSINGGNNSLSLGGLVGENYCGSISDCYAAGSVSGDYFLGGLCGGNSGNINNCYAIGSVSCGDNSWGLGGLVGYNSSGCISNCYATGDVTGEFLYEGGGLVGRHDYGSISNCYATGNVSGGDYSENVGGLVGHNDSGSISNCYATGSAGIGDESWNLGGLVGNNDSGSINNCYSTGSVSIGNESYNRGGLVGYNENGTITGSFWDTQTSGTHHSDGGWGLTTTTMWNIDTYINEGWDFVAETTNGTSEVWQMPAGDGYPVLSNFNGYSTLALAGNGTPDNPYLIGDPNELGAIYHYDSSAYYQLDGNIDLSGIYWNTVPIPFFCGCFDGNDHTITALTIRGGGHIGLFGCIGSNGKIKNLGMLDVKVTGNAKLGGLAGCNSGSISNCYVTGEVSGDNYLGGLVGYNYSGSVSNCYATGNVSGGDYSRFLGGLVGCNGSSISNCYATGSISGNDYLGGLVGYNGSSISNCYATGSISGDDYLGGLVGYNYSGIIINSFWDMETSGMSGSAGGTGKTTAQMQTQSTFTDYGWDFMGEDVNGTDDIWRMCVDGIDYPKLSWQFLAGDFTCPDGVNLADFAVLADTWSLSSDQAGYNDLCDLMDDDVIDLNDLAVFAENWMEGT